MSLAKQASCSALLLTAIFLSSSQLIADDRLSLVKTSPDDSRVLHQIERGPFTVPGGVVAMQYSPDGNSLFAGVRTGGHANRDPMDTVAQLDASTGRISRRFRLCATGWQVTGDLIIGLRFEPKNRAGFQTRVGWWKLSDLSPVWMEPEAERISFFAVAPDGRSIVCTERGQKGSLVLKSLKLSDGSVLWEAPVSDPRRLTELNFVTNDILMIRGDRLRFFDAKAGAELTALNKIFQPLEAPFNDVTTQPERGLLSVIDRRNLHVWRVVGPQEAQPVIMLEPDGEPIRGARTSRFIGNGQSLYVADHSGGYVIPLVSGAVPRKVQERRAVLAVDQKGGRLATACCHSISVLATATWKPLNVFSTHQHEFRELEFNRDGTLLAICNNDGISFWDPAKGQYAGFFENISPDGGNATFAFGPDDRTMFTSDGFELWSWDYSAALQAGAREAPKTTPFRRRLTAWSPDSADAWCHIASAPAIPSAVFSLRSEVFLVDPTSKGVSDFMRLPRLPIPKRQTDPPISLLRLSRDGKRILLKREAYVEVYDAETRSKVSDFTNTGRVAFSSDGQLAAVVDNSEKQIEIRLLESGARDIVLPVGDPVSAAKRGRYNGPDHITAIGFSEDAKYLLVGLRNFSTLTSSFVIWNTETGRRAASVSCARGFFTDFRFSPSGDVLATMNAEGSVTIWNVKEILRRGAEQ
jgi:WD40 repeat protein